MPALLVVGCSNEPDRSAAAVCATYERESIRLYGKYSAQAAALDPEADPLAGLVGSLGMILETQGDFAVLFDRLAMVAPEEIEPEVLAVRDSFKQQAEAMQGAAASPFGSLVSGLFAGLQAQGSYRQAEDYLVASCDVDGIKRKAKEQAQ